MPRPSQVLLLLTGLIAHVTANCVLITEKRLGNTQPPEATYLTSTTGTLDVVQDATASTCCRWIIEVKQGQKINFNFDQFDEKEDFVLMTLEDVDQSSRLVFPDDVNFADYTYDDYAELLEAVIGSDTPASWTSNTNKVIATVVVRLNPDDASGKEITYTTTGKVFSLDSNQSTILTGVLLAVMMVVAAVFTGGILVP